jgi:hypothetical protein
MDELGVRRDALRGARPDDGAIPALQTRVPEDVHGSRALMIRDGAFQAQGGPAADYIGLVLHPAPLGEEREQQDGEGDEEAESLHNGNALLTGLHSRSGCTLSKDASVNGKAPERSRDRQGAVDMAFRSLLECTDIHRSLTVAAPFR